MPHYAGKGGAVWADAVAVAGVSNWELTYSGDALESTGFDDSGLRNYIAGLSGWSASFDAHWDSAQMPNTNPPDLNPGSIITVIFYLYYNAVPATAKFYTGSVVITEISVTTPVDGIVDYSISAQGTGALTLPA